MLLLSVALVLDKAELTVTKDLTLRLDILLLKLRRLGITLLHVSSSSNIYREFRSVSFLARPGGVTQINKYTHIQLKFGISSTSYWPRVDFDYSVCSMCCRVYDVGNGILIIKLQKRIAATCCVCSVT